MEVKLVVGKGKTTIKEIPVVGVSTTFGRRTDCTVRIPSPLVSRLHCELILEESRLLVKDLGSANGTFVNGAKIQEKELRSGDTLGVGPLTFIVQVAGAPASPSDTARPSAAGEAAEAVVVAEAVPDDAADFVVTGEEVAADDAADFVVAGEEPTTTTDADFVVAEESATAEADFVVAEEATAESDTVHDMTFDQVAAGEKAAPAETDDATFVMEEAEAPEPETEEPPKKKPGLFGRLFKKKEKKPAAKPDPAPKPAEPAPVAVTPAAKPRKATAPPAAPPTAPAPKPAADQKTAAPHFAKQGADPEKEAVPHVGDDDLADFLMGLNEKDQ